MPKAVDLSGQRFGRLLVVKPATNKGAKRRWECLCDCGQISFAHGYDLKSGRHQSCGCLQREKTTKHGATAKPQAASGKRFGRLVMVKALHVNGKLRWECQCDCGKTKTVDQGNLLQGHIKSCGCLRVDMGRIKRTKDLTGQRFGRLLVLERGTHIKGVAAWRCQCDCGNEANVRTNCLTANMTKSCGCWKRESLGLRSFHDLTGQTFERLIVLFRAPDKGHHVQWVCQCSCGTLRIIDAYALTSGKTRSCGCYNLEQKTEHGASNTQDVLLKRTYYSWQAMKDRCSNPNTPGYSYYGGRGISVSEIWAKSFQAFLDDMGIKPTLEHSLDRYPDKDGPYTKENCRWATKAEQSQNRRPQKFLGNPPRSTVTGRWTT